MDFYSLILLWIYGLILLQNHSITGHFKQWKEMIGEAKNLIIVFTAKATSNDGELKIWKC